MQSPGYADYTAKSIGDQALGYSSTIVNLAQHISTIVPFAGPSLCAVFEAAQQLITAVGEMQDNKDDCEHLLERILLFVQGVAEELRMLDTTFPEASSTAARLRALSLNILAIKADVDRWKEWGTAKRFMNRASIKTGLQRHGENLTDCFHTFSVRTNVRAGIFYDSFILAPSPEQIQRARSEEPVKIEVLDTPEPASIPTPNAKRGNWHGRNKHNNLIPAPSHRVRTRSEELPTIAVLEPSTPSNDSTQTHDPKKNTVHTDRRNYSKLNLPRDYEHKPNYTHKREYHRERAPSDAQQTPNTAPKRNYGPPRRRKSTDDYHPKNPVVSK